MDLFSILRAQTFRHFICDQSLPIMVIYILLHASELVLKIHRDITQFFIWFKVKSCDDATALLHHATPRHSTATSFWIIKSFYDNLDAHAFQYSIIRTLKKSNVKKWTDQKVRSIQEWLISFSVGIVRMQSTVRWCFFSLCFSRLYRIAIRN